VNADFLYSIAEDGGGLYYPAGPDTVEDVYGRIYEEITTCGIKDITLTDKVAFEPNVIELDTRAISPTPMSWELNADGNEYTITWELPSLEVSERLEFGYEVELFELKAGEERPVNNLLTVTGYDESSGKQLKLEIGPQSVFVYGTAALEIRADKDEYLPGQLARLDVTFEAPDALKHVVFGTGAHFGQGVGEGVDVERYPGNVVLQYNESTGLYNEWGTLKLTADAGGAAWWGEVDFEGWYPGQYEIFNRINNYVLSNKVTDVYRYERDSGGDGWWQDETAGWYAEAGDMIVDNALTTEEGWIVSVPVTGRLDSRPGPNDFTIEAWVSTDSNAIVFYRGNGDANHLSIYTYDDGGTERLYVDCNIAGFDPNIRSVELSVDSNDWHYIALAVEERAAELYVDGNTAAETWTYEMDVMCGLEGMGILIGGELFWAITGDYRTYPCRVDEVRIFGRALEPNEIGANYEQGKDYHLPCDDRADLVGYWDFGAGAQDKSDCELGGLFVEAYQVEPGDYGARRITGRCSDANFPAVSYIIASAASIDIIDAGTGLLWMRLPTDRAFLWPYEDVWPSCVFAHDGIVYAGQDSHPAGLSIIDFRQDQVRLVGTGLSDGLTADWKLNETTGTTAADSSGNGFDGALMNGLCFDGNSVGGVFGAALNFCEVTDYINCPDLSFDANAQYTYSLWLNDQAYGGAVLFDTDPANETGFGLEIIGSASLKSFATQEEVLSTSWSMNTEVWYHVALTYSGDDSNGSGALYVDGGPVGGYYDERFVSSSGNLNIGYCGPGYYSFDGFMDDVRVYERVLSVGEIRALYAQGNTSSNGHIENRFCGASDGVYAYFDEPVLRSGYVHDVAAATVGDANYVAVATNKGLALIKDEALAYDSGTTAEVRKVFITDTNDLYFVIREPNGDSLFAVYDIGTIGDDFEPDAVYGYRDQNEPNLLRNRINDLHVVPGDVNDGNNTIYMATTRGVVRIREDQNDRSQGAKAVYLCSLCGQYVSVLAGDSNNVEAVYADENRLWAATSVESSPVVSIIDLSEDELADYLTVSSSVPLANGSVAALDWGLVGTTCGAMAFEPDFVIPVSVRARCIYSDNAEEPGDAVSDWTDWITAPPGSIMGAALADGNSSRPLTRSRYLEVEAKLTRGDDPHITPVLEAVSVGHTPTELAIGVRVEDDNGVTVAEIDRVRLTGDEMGGTNCLERYFDTTGTRPCDYDAVAAFVDVISGQSLAIDKDDFAITGPGPDVIHQTVLRASVVTDKRSYQTGETVVIRCEVFNDSNSAAVDEFDVQVYVREPNQTCTLLRRYHIDSLQPGGVDVKKLYYKVSSHMAPGPDYSALLVLGQDSEENPTDTAEFEVVGSCGTAGALVGTLTVDPARVDADEVSTIVMNMTVTNTGNEDITDVNLSLTVLDMSDPNEPNGLESWSFDTGDLTVQEPKASVSHSYSPVGLAPSTYPVVLSASFKCGGGETTEADLAIAGFTVARTVASGACEYVIIDLGTVGAGGSYARGLNESGAVTGYATVDGNSHAFLWKCGQMVDLDAGGALTNSVGCGISGFEQIAGYYYSGSEQDTNGFVWQDDSFGDIGTGPAGAWPVQARAINDKGQAAGNYTLSSGLSRACVWYDPANNEPYWDDLSTSGISAIEGFAEANSIAPAIDANGNLAGYWESGVGTRGFVRVDGVVEDAGQHKGADTFLCAMNTSGQAAGYSNDEGSYTALRYHDRVWTVLNPAGAQGRAYGINSDGEIVGSYKTDGDWEAFIWRGGEMYDLKGLLALKSTAGDWWDLTEARAINDGGQIVGSGTIEGEVHAFRLDRLAFEVAEPELVLWLRADTGVVKDSNNSVSKWIDQSFSGNDVTAPDANSQPLFAGDISCCKPVIEFDGVDDVLSKHPATVYDGNSTVFLVVTTGSVEGGTLFASEDGGGEPNAFEIELDAGVLQLSTGTVPEVYEISASAAERVILELVLDGTSVTIYKNSLAVSSHTLGQTEGKRYTDYVLGKGRGGDYLAYEVAEVLVFAGALSQEHRLQVEQYLAGKHELSRVEDVEAPKLWLKADAGVTVDSNSKVSLWADQSGNGFDADQSDPCSRPVRQGGAFDCQPAIWFAGQTYTEPNIIPPPAKRPSGVVLALDRSGSMGYPQPPDNPQNDAMLPPRFGYAKEAGLEFLRQLMESQDTNEPNDPNGHWASLITFEADVVVVDELTVDVNMVMSDLNDVNLPNGINNGCEHKKGLAASIDEIERSRAAEVNALPETHPGQILFLTDGICPDSKHAKILEQARRAERLEIQIYPVAIGAAPDNEALWREVARITRGAYYECADPNLPKGELTGIFLEILGRILAETNGQTISAVLRTGPNVVTPQVLFVEGDANSGLSLYVDANELYFGVWDAETEVSPGTWGPSYVRTGIEPNTTYYATLTYRYNDNITGRLNGVEFDVSAGAGELPMHSATHYLGGNPNEPTRFHDGRTDANNFYVGHIAEFLYYDSALCEAERGRVELYLAEKYGFEIEHNVGPTAVAGADIVVTDHDSDGRADVNLAATAYDDGNEVTFEWWIDGEVAAVGANATIELEAGAHTVKLVVTDSEGMVGADTVVVTVEEVSAELASTTLAAHWKFDGDCNDSSGNGFNAEAVNASGPSCWQLGRVGESIRLVADSNEYVDLSPDGNCVKYLPAGASERTISGWFEAGDNEEATFFDYGTDSPNEPGGRFGIVASCRRVAACIGGHVIGVDNIYPALKGWHHLAVVFPAGARSSNQVQVFLDGRRQTIYTLDGSTGPVRVNTNTWSGEAYAYIGRDCKGNYYNGKIDDVRVLGSTLRDSEVSAFRGTSLRYHVVDLGLLEASAGPQSSEAVGINNRGEVIGRTAVLLRPGTEYYWRIDEKNDCATTKGDTWSFTASSEE